jgi:hypothetical protein
MEVSQEKRFSTAKEMQKALRKAFSQMQEAMSAQTIAFASPAELPSSKIEQPSISMQPSAPEPSADADSQATKLRSDSQPSVDSFAPSSVGQEATAQYGGSIDSGVRQADVKTEVYQAGSVPLYMPADSTSGSSDVPSVPSQTEDWSSPSSPSENGDFSPDATVANFDIASAPPSSPFSGDESFASSTAQENSYATRVSSPEVSVQSNVAPPVAPSPAKKKSSKAIWVVGGLFILFILGIAVAGGGWFVYNNYYASVAPEPTPSPEPSVEVTPTPEPTVESIANSNSNTSTAELDSNSNSNSTVSTVEPTPSPENEPPTRETAPRTQGETKKTSGKSNTPVAAKPTPKKPSRTDILQ